MRAGHCSAALHRATHALPVLLRGCALCPGPRGRGGRGGPRKEVNTTRYYELLVVEKTATEVEIKKAFRKQAMVHHPDRGGNADTFKELNKAYEVLSDAKKRALYDEGGEEALAEEAQGGGGGGGMDIFDRQ